MVRVGSAVMNVGYEARVTPSEGDSLIILAPTYSKHH